MRFQRQILAWFCIFSLSVACGKGFQVKGKTSEMTGLVVKDSRYRTNQLVDENMDYEKFVSKDPATPDATYTPQSRGSFDRGSLVNASLLPSKGSGYIASPAHRLKHYSNFELQKVITFAAAEVRKKYPQGSPLEIGSLSPANGGRNGDHKSHQNGTDADIYYYSINESDDHDMVKGGKVLDHFDYTRNYLFMKHLVSTGRVIRIFVSEEIKRALCNQAAFLGESTTVNETLRRIRPEAGHDDHMHIRTYCPFGSIPGCLDQEEISKSQGPECEVLKLKMSFKK
ncbi:MAG: penicillin-insensitive murein endopeptidase [Bdellovibrionales bacterium]